MLNAYYQITVILCDTPKIMISAHSQKFVHANLKNTISQQYSCLVMLLILGCFDTHLTY